MSISIGAVLRESTDRLSTAAGAAIFGMVFLVSLLNTVAAHNQDTGLEEAREELAAAEDDPDLAPVLETMEEFLETLAASQSLFDVGLSSGAATALAWLMTFAMGVVVLVGVRAIGEETDRLDASLLDGLGWRVVNLVGGAIGLGVVGFIVGIVGAIVSIIVGFIPVVGPVLVLVGWLLLAVLFAVGLFYWVPAITIEGENAIEAAGTSMELARANVLPTTGLVLLYYLLAIIDFVLFLALLFTAGPVVPTVTTLLIGVVTTGLGIAWMGTAYDLAVPDDEPAAVSHRPDEGPSEQFAGESQGWSTADADEEQGWSSTDEDRTTPAADEPAGESTWGTDDDDDRR